MAGLFNFDPNDPRIAAAVMGTNVIPPVGIDANPTLAQAPSTDPGALQGVPDVQAAPQGLLGKLKDATYTPDANGMTFWDKLGAFGQSLSHAQAGLDGTLGGAAGGQDPGLATLQAFKDKQAQAAQRQQTYALGQQLFPNSPAKALLFATNPDFQKSVSDSLGGNLKNVVLSGGQTDHSGEGGPDFTASELVHNGNVYGTQSANGFNVTGTAPYSADEIAALQNAQNGAVTANKPQVVSEGASLVQSGVAPSLVAGMPGAANGSQPAGGQPRVLYTAPKTYAPTAGGEGGVAPSALTDEAVQNIAEQVAGGGAMPALGVGKAAVGLKTAILNRVAQIQKAGGVDGYNALYGKADLKSQTAALQQAMKTRQAMQAAEQQANSNLDAGLAAARAGGAAPGVPFVSGLLQQARIAGNDPKAVTTHNYIDTAAEELAKVTSGSTGSTPASDSARHAAKSRLNDGMSLPALEAAAQAARIEMANRVKAQQAVEDGIRQRITQGSYGQNAAMGAAPTADQLRAKSAAARGAAPGWQIVGVQ